MFYHLSRHYAIIESESDWDEFKKWVEEDPHREWEITKTGERLWNQWCNIQSAKERESLENEFGYKGKKYLCKVCGEKKTIDQVYKFDTTPVMGKWIGIYVRTGTCKCNDCLEAERARRKQLQEERKKKSKKQWYQDHKEELAEKQRQQRAAKNESNRKYAKAHREQINQYISDRKKNDPIFKLSCQVRNTVYASFARTGHVKPERCESITGLSQDDLIAHLIATYKDVYGFAWDKKTPVHIDHIVPLATAKTEEDVIRLCHYSNLRLIKAEDNLRKGAKLDYAI